MLLPNIYRSKGNQTMKLGQLIDYKMRNIFLEKSLTKVGGETITRPFTKKLKLSIYLDQQSQVLQKFPFITCQIEGYQNILKLSCRPLVFTAYKAFFKN